MGRSGRWAGRLRRLGWFSVATGAAALVMTACGSQLASSTGAVQSTRPAHGPSGTPTPRGGEGGSGLCSQMPIPAVVTVTSPAQARAVARSLCALPRMPSAPMPCPMDQGVSYRLDFAAGRASFPPVTAAAGGCNPVTGAGPVRRAAAAGFWIVLGQAIGIKHAAGSALRGTSRAG